MDDDNNRIPDAVEITCTPGVAQGNPCNGDGDMLPDYRDYDSDNDLVFDVVEAGPDPRNPIDTDDDNIPAFRDADEVYITQAPIAQCAPEQGEVACGLEMIRNTLANAGVAVTLDDPPVPALLFATTPYPRPSGGAQAVLTTTTTLVLAPLAVTRAASHTVVAGQPPVLPRVRNTLLTDSAKPETNQLVIFSMRNLTF